MEEFQKKFPRPLFIIIFRPEMLKFHPYSIFTGDTRFEFVMYHVLSVLNLNYKMDCSWKERYKIEEG